MMLAAPEATAVGAMNATFDPSSQSDAVLQVPALGLFAGSSGSGIQELLQPRFPNLEYQKIAGTGHFLMIEKPEEFNRLLLAFLARQKY